MNCLGLFGLSARADDRTGAYSKGMKQRLALARAWLTHPKILFLDEPTSGLDPEAAVQVRELISDVRQKEGTTVLICTHNLDEAQRLCDRLLVMRQGTSVAQGSLQDLRSLVSAGLWVDFSFLDAVDFDQFSGVSIPGLMETKVNSATEFSAAVRDEKDIPEVIAAFVNHRRQRSCGYNPERFLWRKFIYNYKTVEVCHELAENSNHCLERYFRSASK